jgi:hypothetical protein
MPKTYEQYQEKYKAYFEAQKAYQPDWHGIARSFVQELEESQLRLNEQRRAEDLRNLSVDGIHSQIGVLMSRLKNDELAMVIQSVINSLGTEVLSAARAQLDTEIQNRMESEKRMDPNIKKRKTK